MKIALRILATALAAMPLAAMPLVASAITIRVSYDGTVEAIYGDGWGYSIGDSVSGWFELDTDDLSDAFGDGSVWSSGGPVNSNFSSLVDGVYSIDYDSVFLTDVGWLGADSISAVDGSQQTCDECNGNYREQQAVIAELNMRENAEWFDMNALLNGESLSFSAIELPSIAYAYIVEFDWFWPSRFSVQPTVRKHNQARILLDSVTIGAVSSNQLIEQLILSAMTLNLQKGISNSLDGKLDAALRALDDMNSNNDIAAINSLLAFISAVTAQSGNQIPADDACDLVASADAVIVTLGGQSTGNACLFQ